MDTQTEKSRKSNVGNFDAYRASLAKPLKSKKHLETEK